METQFKVKFYSHDEEISMEDIEYNKEDAIKLAITYFNVMYQDYSDETKKWFINAFQTKNTVQYTENPMNDDYLPPILSIKLIKN